MIYFDITINTDKFTSVKYLQIKKKRRDAAETNTFLMLILKL